MVKDELRANCADMVTGHGDRRTASELHKQEVISAFESSSLSGPAFARQCGIKYPTFASA
jgi:hypothetical protein